MATLIFFFNDVFALNLEYMLNLEMLNLEKLEKNEVFLTYERLIGS